MADEVVCLGGLPPCCAQGPWYLFSLLCHLPRPQTGFRPMKARLGAESVGKECGPCAAMGLISLPSG